MGRREVELLAEELDRQWYTLKVRLGEDAYKCTFSVPFERFIKGMQELETGKIREGLDEAIGARLQAERLDKTDSIAALTFTKKRYDARVRGHSHLAGLLVLDAVIAAARGISKEQWILHVLTGHAGNDDAELECLREIVALWTDGVMPWSKGTEPLTLASDRASQ
jgi:hypothetical protein